MHQSFSSRSKASGEQEGREAVLKKDWENGDERPRSGLEAKVYGPHPHEQGSELGRRSIASHRRARPKRSRIETKLQVLSSQSGRGAERS